MIKRIIHIIIWLGIIVWMTVIMGFVNGAKEKVLCKQINIDISDSTDIRFVTSNMVRGIIAGTGIQTRGYPVEDIQTRKLESIIEQNAYVANAEAHVTIDGFLNIDIDQRIPLMRIMPGGKGGYYVDQEGYIMPLSESFAPMVLLFTGDLDLPEVQGENADMMLDTARAEISRMMAFSRHVSSSGFWNRQIVQVYRTRQGSYEIIPRVGAHQINFGSLENYQEKLRNLKLLYEQGFSTYGWNTYNKIDLEYANQIICTKR